MPAIDGNGYSSQRHRPGRVAKAQKVSIHGTKISKLTPWNYYTWISEAESVLWIEKKWGYVKPNSTTRSNSLIEGSKEWKEEKITFHLLKLMITAEVWQDLSHYTTASDVWQALEKQLEARAEAHQRLLLQKLEGVKLLKEESMQSYITRVGKLTAEFKLCGGSASDVSMTSYLIKGLPSEYKIVQTIANSHRQDLEKVKALLLGEEAYRIDMKTCRL